MLRSQCSPTHTYFRCQLHVLLTDQLQTGGSHGPLLRLQTPVTNLGCSSELLAINQVSATPSFVEEMHRARYEERVWRFHALPKGTALSKSPHVHQPESYPKPVLLGFYGGFNRQD